MDSVIGGMDDLRPDNARRMDYEFILRQAQKANSARSLSDVEALLNVAGSQGREFGTLTPELAEVIQQTKALISAVRDGNAESKDVVDSVQKLVDMQGQLSDNGVALGNTGKVLNQLTRDLEQMGGSFATAARGFNESIENFSTGDIAENIKDIEENFANLRNVLARETLAAGDDLAARQRMAVINGQIEAAQAATLDKLQALAAATGGGPTSLSLRAQFMSSEMYDDMKGSAASKIAGHAPKSMQSATSNVLRGGGAAGLMKYAGMAGVALGAGKAAYSFAESQQQEMQQLRGVAGDMSHGRRLQMDMDARMRGLTTIGVNAGDMKEAQQAALSQGLRGDSMESAVDYSVKALRDFGVSVSESTAMYRQMVVNMNMSTLELNTALDVLSSTAEGTDKSFEELRKEFESSTGAFAASGTANAGQFGTLMTASFQSTTEGVSGTIIAEALGSSQMLGIELAKRAGTRYDPSNPGASLTRARDVLGDGGTATAVQSILMDIISRTTGLPYAQLKKMTKKDWERFVADAPNAVMNQLKAELSANGISGLEGDQLYATLVMICGADPMAAETKINDNYAGQVADIKSGKGHKGASLRTKWGLKGQGINDADADYNSINTVLSMTHGEIESGSISNAEMLGLKSWMETSKFGAENSFRDFTVDGTDMNLEKYISSGTGTMDDFLEGRISVSRKDGEKVHDIAEAIASFATGGLDDAVQKIEGKLSLEMDPGSNGNLVAVITGNIDRILSNVAYQSGRPRNDQ